MPLSREQRKQLLASKGFDPISHDFDEISGDITEYPGGVPSDIAGPSEPVTTPILDSPGKSSSFNVAAKSALESAPSTLGSLAIGAQVGARIPGPWPVKLAGGLGAALVGGAGIKKIQDAVVPEGVRKVIFPTEQERIEHPVATTIGDLAPSALALDPIKSIQGLARAGGLLGRAAVSPSGIKALTAPELAALQRYGVNTGINVGTQAGLNVAEQLGSDQPFSVGELGKAAALGLLLNEPTRLGRRYLGFQPSFEGVPTRGQVESSRLAEIEAAIERQRRPAVPVAEPAITEAQSMVIQPSGEMIPSGINRATDPRYPFTPNVIEGADISRYERRPVNPASTSAENIIQQRPVLDELVDTLAAEKRAMESRIEEVEKQNAQLMRGLGLEGQAPYSQPVVKPDFEGSFKKLQDILGSTPPAEISPETRKYIATRNKRIEDYKKALEIKKVLDEMDSRKALSDLQKRQMANILATKPDQSILNNLKSLMEGGVARPEVRVTPKETPTGKEIYPDYTGVTEFDVLQNKITPPTEGELLMRKLMGEKFQETPTSPEQFTQLEPEIKKLMARRGLKPGQYRVQITDAKGNPILGPSTKQPVAGRTVGREVSFGEKAGADTAYHEAGHVYIDDLARSADAKDRSLVDKAFAEIGHPEVTAESWVKAQDEGRQADVLGAEELLMDRLGFLGARRKLTAAKGKEWLKDTLARFGVGETPAQRKLSARLEYDAPTELPKKGENAPSKIEVKEGVQGEREEGISGRKEDEAGISNRLQREEEGEVAPKLQEESKPIEPELKEAPVVYKGFQEGIGEMKGFHLYNIIGDAEGLPKNSTVTEKSLNEKGYKVPAAEKAKEGGKMQEESKPFEEEGKLISFKDQLDAKIEVSLEKAKEIFKQTGIKVGDIMYTDSGTQMKIISPTVHYRRIKVNGKKVEDTSNPLVFVEQVSSYKGNDSQIGAKSTAYLNKLHIDNPNVKLQEESSPIPADELSTRKPFFNVFTSVTDKVRTGKGGSKAHEVASKAGRNYFDEKSQLEGRYGNSIIKAIKGYTAEESKRVYQYQWARDNNEPLPFQLTAKEKQLDEKLKPLIQRPKLDANEIGLKVKRGEAFTPGGIKPEGYLPNQLDPKVLAAFDANPNSIESKSYKNKWKEWLLRKGADNPDQMIKEWEAARRDYGDTSGPEFAALRKPEGFGFPWELMDQNPARAWSRYARRAAADISFFKHIQSRDDVRAALNVKDQFGELPKDVEGIENIGSEADVQKMMKFIYGKTKPEHPRIEAFSRAVGSMIMGPGTAIRNLASVPSQLAGMDVTFKQALKGLSDIGKIKTEAFEQNVTRADFSEFDRYGDYDNPDSVVNTLDKLSNFFRKWQGRNLSDKWEGEYIYAVGKEWVSAQQAKAQAGDTRAKILLQRVGNLVENPITTTKPEDLAKMATGFVNVVRGSYGPQGLPSWALHGNLAPFVALSKYSIERWNNVYKDVITPAKNGNVGPLLKYTLASLVGGAGIEQINELISGRKGAELNLEESLALWAKNGDPELLASKAIALAQLSAYAGIVGDLAKLSERVVAGKDVKYNNPLSFPAYTFVSDTIASNFGQALGAMREGEDPIDVLAEFVKTVGVESIQGVRYARNRLEPEETARKEEFADLRKFREATGQETPEGEDKPNEFKNLASKEFKRTSNVNEAVEELPALLKRAFEKAGNDPYKLKAEFRKLKQNSYQSLPAPETQPIEFWEYLQYLRSTQGEEVASQRLSKFLNQRAVNKAKAGLVP